MSGPRTGSWAASRTRSSSTATARWTTPSDPIADLEAVAELVGKTPPSDAEAFAGAYLRLVESRRAERRAEGRGRERMALEALQALHTPTEQHHLHPWRRRELERRIRAEYEAAQPPRPRAVVVRVEGGEVLWRRGDG